MNLSSIYQKFVQNFEFFSIFKHIFITNPLIFVQIWIATKGKSLSFENVQLYCFRNKQRRLEFFLKNKQRLSNTIKILRCVNRSLKNSVAYKTY